MDRSCCFDASSLNGERRGELRPDAEVVEVEVEHPDSVTSWQCATVKHYDKGTMSYTLRIGAQSWGGIKGDVIRPAFIVGNFVRVLHHRITDSKFRGHPEWVPGVIISVQKVAYVSAETEGHLYTYRVLRLDADTKGKAGSNILTVTIYALDMHCRGFNAYQHLFLILDMHR